MCFNKTIQQQIKISQELQTILIILIINTIIIINDKNNISNYGGSDLQFIIIQSLRAFRRAKVLWNTTCFYEI